jgi:hypothetical protein
VGDHLQFAPLDKPYLKPWRERLDASQKSKNWSRFADKELDKVVKRIKKMRGRKPR